MGKEDAMMYANRFLNRHGPGWLLVAAVFGLLVAAIHPAQAQRLTTLYSFTGGADGYGPLGTLIKDKAGNVYGTAVYGGIQNPNCNVNGAGCGTVFELTPSGRGWTFNVLYGFGGYPNDGANPYFEALAFDKAGNLYGTTMLGGDLSCSLGAPGCGTVFKLTPSGGGWTESVLYNFTGAMGEYWPRAALVLDKKGNLYSTIAAEVFEITASRTEKAFYYFKGGADGYGTWAGLVFDQKGNLYGTTANGGGSGCWGSGCGTVFKLAPDGTETVLYRFAGGVDGYSPMAGLVLDKRGNLYGTTELGGGLGCGGSGCGTVFEVTPTGTETVLYSFQGTPDGSYPRGGLIFDKEGNLYGTTWLGGSPCWGYCGTVFKLTPSGGTWTETVLHSFCSAGGYPCPDGAGPQGSLLLKGGILYGTTSGGGANNLGTVFALNPRQKKK